MIKSAKRTFTVLLAVLMIFGLLVPGALAAETEAIEPLSFPFTDVSAGSWYRSYVQAVLDQNIMQGTSSTRFSPNDTFSRGQIVATLFRIHHNRNANANDNRNNPFNDIGNAWYTSYVTWAHNNGISSGTSATRFGANDHLTRQEIATIMHNYVRNLTDHNSGSTATAQWNAFTDRGQITFSGAYNAFRWANNHGIVNGRTTTTLAPNGTANRAEAAAMLVRLVNFMGGGSQQPPPTDETTLEQEVRNGAAYWQLQGRFPSADIQNAFEQEMLRLVNIERAAHGVTAVQWSTTLATAAREHSVDMATNNFLGHIGSDGRGILWRAMDAGWDGMVSENASSFDTPARVMNGIMASPGHRATLLDARWTHLGVGFARSASGEYRWTQKFGAPW